MPPSPLLIRFKLSLVQMDHSAQTGVSWIPRYCLNLWAAVQVHKFSKFIHGSATLLPDLVQAVPYWVDDESVRPSMLQSAPAPPSCAPCPSLGACTDSLFCGIYRLTNARCSHVRTDL